MLCAVSGFWEICGKFSIDLLLFHWTLTRTLWQLHILCVNEMVILFRILYQYGHITAEWDGHIIQDTVLVWPDITWMGWSYCSGYCTGMARYHMNEMVILFRILYWYGQITPEWDGHIVQDTVLVWPDNTWMRWSYFSGYCTGTARYHMNEMVILFRILYWYSQISHKCSYLQTNAHNRN
jgi:hypothetical protein